MVDARTGQASQDEVTISAIRYLTACGLTPVEIAEALRIDASAADRVRNGGDFRPNHFVPSKGRF